MFNRFTTQQWLPGDIQSNLAARQTELAHISFNTIEFADIGARVIYIIMFTLATCKQTCTGFGTEKLLKKQVEGFS